MTETTNRDALQAAYFVRELELAADTLVGQIAKLDLLKGAQREAQRRRRELYDVRRQIEAIRRRFPSPSSPRPSHRRG
ncbi:hypothetical protein OG579_14840 [Williamsia herbipolensis]|uniref:Uncharacterized protein n=1 Tax=Williamsia herbipolensis TaxID=1603258 RepID=A0AAU4JZ12_9NOCA|nr:hypothetical protein [Williamsia herbipolensis]